MRSPLQCATTHPPLISSALPFLTNVNKCPLMKNFIRPLTLARESQLRFYIQKSLNAAVSINAEQYVGNLVFIATINWKWNTISLNIPWISQRVSLEETCCVYRFELVNIPENFSYGNQLLIHSPHLNEYVHVPLYHKCS